MEKTELRISKMRMFLAGFCFVMCFASPLFIPVVVYLPIPDGAKAIFSGLLLFGIPELFLIATIAISGKEGYQFFKAKFVGLFREVSPHRVSKPRYVTGLFMFVMPLVLSYAISYNAHAFEEYSRNRIAVNIMLDVVFFASFVVLGGEFWDKVRSLFVYKSRAVFLEETE